MIVPGLSQDPESQPANVVGQKLSPQQEMNVLMAAAVMKDMGRFDQPTQQPKRIVKKK